MEARNAGREADSVDLFSKASIVGELGHAFGFAVGRGLGGAGGKEDGGASKKGEAHGKSFSGC